MAIEVKKGLVVLDPTAEPTSAEAHLSPRLDTLEGKVIGFLDNSKLNSDRFLKLLEQELNERYRLGGAIYARKPSASRICPRDTMSDLVARCDAVITAVGD